MVFNRRHVSLRHLLVLLYVIAASLLIALLVREVSGDQPLFSMSQASIEDQPGPAVLSVSGDAFHPGIKGVLAQDLVNEKALLSHHLIGIPAKAFDIRGDLALVSCYREKVVSLELHDGKNPSFLGSLELPGTVNQIKIVGDRALMAMSAHSGLALVDLQDPSALKLVRYYPLQSFVSDMTVDQDSIYYTTLHQGVGRVDLSAENPVPELLAAIDSPMHIDLQGNRLAVGTSGGRVQLFAITQDGQLVEVGALDYPRDVRGVALTGDVLAVALADGSLHVLSLSSWPKLSRSAQLSLPGSPLGLEKVPGQDRIAAALVGGGVSLIDISLPATPVLRGHLKSAKTYKAAIPQSEKIFGTSQEGLEVFSLAEIEEGEYSMLATDAMIEQSYYALQTWNGHVYGYSDNRLVDFGQKTPTDTRSFSRFMAVAGKAGVGLFEQSDNEQLKRAGSLVSLEGDGSAGFRGDYLYIVHGGGLRILSGARPEELVVVSDLPLPGRPTQFAILASGSLLVATRDNGVLVLDVNDPQRPVQIASMDVSQSLQTKDAVQDVLVDGQMVYISRGHGGVHVFDVSSPAQPKLRQIIDTPGFAKKMVLSDGLLLVADGLEGLFMIDVEGRDGALTIGSLPAPLFINQMAVVDDGLIVSGRTAGTMKLPLPRRMDPLQIISDGELRADVATVEKGQYVYLYDERASRKMAVSAQ